MNHICTWLRVDENEQQLTYWRCLLVFFLTSRRFNRKTPHLLFTNATSLPMVDGVDVRRLLEGLRVDVVYTPPVYKTPEGYYHRFQNRFYVFSILKHLAEQAYAADDAFLIVDSDCVFLRSAEKLFETAAPSGFLSFEDEVAPDHVINGLSRNDLRTIYKELLGRPVYDMPSYHLGEFLLCSAANIRRLDQDFHALWPVLLERHALGLSKFNEEAHTLSYLYYRNGWRASARGMHMKRIWTNPLFHRNVESGDGELTLWHLPAEKVFGFVRLFRRLIRLPRYGLFTSGDLYRALVRASMGVPQLPVRMRASYYIQSYYRAIAKRLMKPDVI